MKTIKILAVLMSFFISSCQAQIKNEKSVTAIVYGNCEMCKSTIEKAGDKSNFFKTSWNKDTKLATISFDSTKSNVDIVLKQIALSGYDNQEFLAPDDVYNKLPKCCQYERVKKQLVKNSSANTYTDSTKQVANQLQDVYDAYFALKDALVKSDGNTSSIKSNDLLTSINGVQMDKLPMDVHVVWMKVLNELKEDAEHIANTKDITHQRDHFMSLSNNFYTLIKATKAEQPIYYQHCPMYNNGKGADWLSKDSNIKNPYYGNQMLTCGKTLETIK
jgi:hypothetical protein